MYIKFIIRFVEDTILAPMMAQRGVALAWFLVPIVVCEPGTFIVLANLRFH